MPGRAVQITFDCGSPAALAEYWCEVLGYVIEPPPPGFDSWEEALEAWQVPAEDRDAKSAAIDPAGAGPRLFFQRVPEGKSAKNRVHLDVRVAAGLRGDERMAVLQSEADRLVALGGRQVLRVDPDGRLENGFIWLEDLEGNEFCLD